MSDPSFFPVEKVLKKRKVKGKAEKLVKFLGYKEPRWMPADAVSDLSRQKRRRVVGLFMLVVFN